MFRVVQCEDRPVLLAIVPAQRRGWWVRVLRRARWHPGSLARVRTAAARLDPGVCRRGAGARGVVGSGRCHRPAVWPWVAVAGGCSDGVWTDVLRPEVGHRALWAPGDASTGAVVGRCTRPRSRRYCATGSGTRHCHGVAAAESSRSRRRGSRPRCSTTATSAPSPAAGRQLEYGFYALHDGHVRASGTRSPEAEW